MHILISRNALSELVSNVVGLSGALGHGLADLEDITHACENDIDLILHRDDNTESRRLVIAVPYSLAEFIDRVSIYEADILERLLAFIDIAESRKPILPESWNALKHENRYSFFLTSRERIYGSPRWIAEIRSPADICLWSISDVSAQTELRQFIPPAEAFEKTLACWYRVVPNLRGYFGPKATSGARVDMELPESQFGDVTQDLKYSSWVDKLTPRQRSFVTQPSQHSIKLRGPAGSGKTLTLALKALHAFREAHSRGADLQILFVTHTWALAGEISEMIARLSEWGESELITVLPLVAVAEDLLPSDLRDRDLELIGDDSLTGKLGQLAIIEELLDKVRRGTWLRFRDKVSSDLQIRIESADPGERKALAWDCLTEFGCVLGADGIFHDVADGEARYLRLARGPWMMPLKAEYDKKLVFHLYSNFSKALEEQGKMSSDQLINDLLNYFEMTVWNRRRKRLGYDEIYVDEFHLFNAQERQLLKYMIRSATELPRIFMALDPRQSPWEAYVGASDAVPASRARSDDGFGVSSAVDLTVVHRFSPQILAFVKRIHLEFPNLDLGDDWHLSFSEVESYAEDGPIPTVVHSGTVSAECTEIYHRLRALGPSVQAAVAIVDQNQFEWYSHIARGLESHGIKAKILTGRDDFNPVQYRRRGVVFAPAEYLAGLQFETVLIAGMPDFAFGIANQSYRRRRHLSLLYLAATRASRALMLFVNSDSGGLPHVLKMAHQEGVVVVEEGAAV